MNDKQKPYQLPEHVDDFEDSHTDAAADPVASAWTTDTDLVDGDVDAQMVVDGHDIQGIPWHTMPFTREDFRATRLQDAEGNSFTDTLSDVITKPQKGETFYCFSRNTRRVQCSIVHFQLRNLVWATSNHDVFLMHDASIVHWDAAARRRTPVLHLGGNHVNLGPGESRKALGPSATLLGNVKISTMIATDEFVIAGGFNGELVSKNLRTHAIEHNKRITYDENAITNAIDIYDSRVMTSNNDCFVRIFDLPTFTKVSEFRFEMSVNHATRQPHGKMVAVAGDEHPVIVMDGDTGEKIATLSGHENYNFATGWHPGGHMFATGSQDRTCRIWDARNMSQSVSVLGARVGAMRSLRFSPCGRFIAMAEPCDFVHIYDVTRGDFGLAQEIDLFGEIAGISISPDSHSLFIGLYDRNYGSLLEFKRSPDAIVMPPIRACVV
jgi:WD40 repeat protein